MKQIYIFTEKIQKSSLFWSVVARVFWMVVYRLNSKVFCLCLLVFHLFCPPQKFLWVPDIDMT